MNNIVGWILMLVVAVLSLIGVLRIRRWFVLRKLYSLQTKREWDDMVQQENEAVDKLLSNFAVHKIDFDETNVGSQKDEQE